MIVRTGKNINSKSNTVPLALCELLLAFLLYYYPDHAKIFLFGLPLVLLFGEGVELFYKYFKKRGSIFSVIGGVLLIAAGGILAFSGRKTFMVGIAVLMLFETVRFMIFSRNEKCGMFEKMIYIGAALLSFVWMLLILFKGLHLYWSVRECLALYFVGSAFLSILRKK